MDDLAHEETIDGLNKRGEGVAHVDVHLGGRVHGHLPLRIGDVDLDVYAFGAGFCREAESRNEQDLIGPWTSKENLSGRQFSQLDWPA